MAPFILGFIDGDISFFGGKTYLLSGFGFFAKQTWLLKIGDDFHRIHGILIYVYLPTFG